MNAFAEMIEHRVRQSLQMESGCLRFEFSPVAKMLRSSLCMTCLQIMRRSEPISRAGASNPSMRAPRSWLRTLRSRDLVEKRTRAA